MLAPVRCPKCGGDLVQVLARSRNPASGEAPVQAGDLFLDRCADCGGVWYDVAELERLVGRDPRTLPVQFGDVWRLACCPDCGAEAPAGADACAFCGHALGVRCPRCEDFLRTLRLAGFRLESCPGCRGLWLDAGEATAIANALGIDAARCVPEGITCKQCGRTGLTLSQTMCTEDGLVCDRCGIQLAQDDSAEWQARIEKQSDALFAALTMGAAASVGSRRRH